MALCGLVHDMSIPPGIALSCPNHQSIRPIELSAANDTETICAVDTVSSEINFLSATQPEQTFNDVCSKATFSLLAKRD